MKKGYDTIAFLYDWLAGMVFGNRQQVAQHCYLNVIPKGANILIVGGGSGLLLESIATLHTSGLTITYIDASQQMVARAQKRNTAGNKVRFIAQPLQKADLLPDVYDVVITPFFFDNFSSGTAHTILATIHRSVRRQGLWLYTDFMIPGKMYQEILLKIMYLFFNIFCSIEATQLPDMELNFNKFGYSVEKSKLFSDGFMVSTVYRRM